MGWTCSSGSLIAPPEAIDVFHNEGASGERHEVYQTPPTSSDSSGISSSAGYQGLIPPAHGAKGKGGPASCGPTAWKGIPDGEIYAASDCRQHSRYPVYAGGGKPAGEAGVNSSAEGGVRDHIVSRGWQIPDPVPIVGVPNQDHW